MGEAIPPSNVGSKYIGVVYNIDINLVLCLHLSLRLSRKSFAQQTELRKSPRSQSDCVVAMFSPKTEYGVYCSHVHGIIAATATASSTKHCNTRNHADGSTATAALAGSS